MSEELVSVVMSIYNEPIKYIKESVCSILRQTYHKLQIIIIIDDPSNIDAISLIQKLQTQDERIELLYNEKNIGLVGSLNKGIEKAKGQFIARMDADDISLPQRIEKQLAYLKEHKLDLVGCIITNIDASGKKSNNATKYPETDKGIKKYLRYESAMPHPTWFGKREVFQDLNGYRNIDSCEDYDFLIRCCSKGFRLGNLQETLLYYRINEGGISQTKRVKQKTILSYIRDKYRKNVDFSVDNLQSYLLSVEGEKKQKKLAIYYDYTKSMKKKNGFFFLVSCAWLFIISQEGRNIFKNMLVTNLLNKLY